ncbi:MAG: OmpH family outer membrane protein [Bacteroidia bacterium]|nr:OmpH family outer membrane protein [Bacteroidia bacterium]MBP7260659.1 OmpH family outer membrane protein [Bacteroidia bacterium]MBP9180668.1 OmpH family outer membrane protein [Bacteroidia bacterium]MBP9724301.1 OmpH family outer membrane protein [Bacteroidia bacterium]
MKRFLSLQLLPLYVLILSCWAYVVLGNKQEHVAYVNTPKLFKEFLLTKKLEMQLTEITSRRKSSLDSMIISLGVLNEQVKKAKENVELTSRLQSGKAYYMQQNEFFSQDNERIKAEYDKQIWNQLNQYIKDYGIKHHFDMIIGADGSGSLMYADSRLDITDQVVEYSNNRFTGVEK